MFGNMTAILEDTIEWKRRFGARDARMTDPDLVAEALEACAETDLLAVAIKKFGDVRGEIIAASCKDQLKPGRASSNTVVALWTPPVGKPDWGFNAVIIALVAIACYVLYRGEIPGGLSIPVIRSPIEVTLEQW